MAQEPRYADTPVLNKVGAVRVAAIVAHEARLSTETATDDQQPDQVMTLT